MSENMATEATEVQQILETMANRFRGPGGAAAVLKDGQLIGQHVWGYADLDKLVPMTARTPMPMCSITKQMVCGLLMDLERAPTPTMVARGLPDGPADIRKQLSGKLADWLPAATLDAQPGLTIERMCNNKSGIRDPWALTVLWGAHPEGKFSLADHGPAMRARLGAPHFVPGTEYSYCNANFYLLGRLIEDVSGEDLADLLAQRLFEPAGMATAALVPDADKLPPPCVGYEGSENLGYVPARNRLEWSGDGGMVGSLDDMIAYERYFDGRWAALEAWYRDEDGQRDDPLSFSDGSNPNINDSGATTSAAAYQYGLGCRYLDSAVSTIGHGGALRGFRLHRMYAPRERLSVVVLFNHQAVSGVAAEYVLRRLVGLPTEPATPPAIEPDQAWFGHFLDEETQLAVTVSRLATGKINLSYSGAEEPLQLSIATSAHSKSMNATIEGNVLRIRRIEDNRTLIARRLDSVPADSHKTDPALQGTYHCAEIDSTFFCDGRYGSSGGVLYGSFEGFLGRGPAHIMRHLGEDVWLLACPRGMDAPAPGDWTMVFHRDADNLVTGFTIGCWLARRLEFVRNQ
ncbi:beta-lactamase/transpeptidase-like protein [Mycena galopus ATCC 62051]|nr:beta-lactamase/transpeptidase-like protein [Mycena galopus ATCC 62051]